MEIIKNKIFDEERALYGRVDLSIENCRFDGPKDGESAFKECMNINVKDSFFNLRYPFWHDDNLMIDNIEMTDKCRAALWYSSNIQIRNSKLHGIKALRECSNVVIEDSDIISPEFGWSTGNIKMTNSNAEAEYFMMRSSDLNFMNVTFKGKYSFQYIEDAYFEDCNFDTKDAFWHGNNVYLKNCLIKGEYLAWYSSKLTLDHCKIIGTQPLCYCKELKLIDCEMIDCDLSFEKSEVEAKLISPIISIKNPKQGTIVVPKVNEIIMDDPNAKGIIKNK